MSKNNFYSSGTKEANIRKEFYNTMYGTNQEIPKSQEGLLRKFRRASDGKRIRCVCVNTVTDEANKESPCQYCYGEKYYWDEIPINFYITAVETEPQMSQRESLRPPGIMITGLYAMYIPASFSLTLEDKIVRLELDREGALVVPNRRRDVIRISALQDMRLDNAKLEYWKANGFAEI